MSERVITIKALEEFRENLVQEERSAETVQKYLRALSSFADWMGDREITREGVLAWKTALCQSGRSAVTVNGCLAALHSFFAFRGWMDCRVRYLKIQRQMFRDVSRELDKGEYTRLVQAAGKKGRTRLALLLETICGTGVRVSEVKYITVEAAKRGRAEISLKGKIRTILISGKLAQKLLSYARKQKIASGEIFLTASGKGMSRGQIWLEMKKLCKAAGVDSSKVFPHNLRHLFARTFHKACKDIVQLADVLGHSSVETTRIYLITTGIEYARQLDRLGLVT